MSDSSKKEQSKKEQKAAELAVVEKISSEIIPYLFHDDERKPWVRLLNEDHYDIFPVNSEEMENHLEGLYFKERGEAMPPKMLKEMLRQLRAKALYGGEKKSVSLRIGENSGVLYIDLGDSKRQVVRITPAGWHLEDQCPVFFRRPEGMWPLPIPERGGSLEELAPFLNQSSDQFILSKGFLLSSFHYKGPYLIMVLNGAEGSAKSTATNILRALIDPNKIPACGEPRNDRDIHVMALDYYLLAYDNIEKLSPKISNAICRVATGGGHVERKLNTNQTKVRFPDICLPQIINGIPAFAVKPDLLSRSIVLQLRPVKRARTEDEFWRDFDSKKGRIFGAILDHLVEGLRNYSHLNQPANLRMTDAVTWVMACGITDYEARFRQNLTNSNRVLLEEDEVVKGIIALMKKRKKPWEGNATKLGLALKAVGYEAPKNARALSVYLRKIASALRSGFGIAVDFPTDTSDLQREAARRPIRISNVG
jgi:hypothetical protein